MANRANPAAIGAFVLGAIALIVAGILAFGSGQYFKHTEEFVMYFPGSVNGLNVGAPVKFKGVDIGQVKNIKLVLQRENDVDRKLLIPVYVETDPTKVFVNGKQLEMADPKNLEALVNRGLRAQLQSQSLVTGLLFVQVDFFPDTPINYALPQPSDPIEIPTVPTALEQAQSAAREIIEELRNVKFGPMVQSAQEAVEQVKVLVSSPALHAAIDGLPGTMKSLDEAIASMRHLSDELHGQVAPLSRRLDSTLANADQTLITVRGAAGTANTILSPGSPLDHDLRDALRQVSDAARALAQLADFLERNPSALLYGKQPPPEVKR
jgi:paraquat-inducible protein B